MDHGSSATTSCRSGEKIPDSSSSNTGCVDASGGGHSTSRFKGVVVQPNGHWGSQIYANHRRIWLGTFKSEKEAAAAYDSAAIKIRNGGPTHLNFPWNDTVVRESGFQNQFSTETVLSMIKDGSYRAKFLNYVSARDKQDCNNNNNNTWIFHDRSGSRGVKLRELFRKELTPSDVSKLNRLVIPKKFALKYFPRVSNNVDDLELVFFDKSMRSWKLRYCYWKSSQSFVFTKGWNRFTKEKGLRPRDKVIFSSHGSGEQKLCVIDVEYRDKGLSGSGGVVEGRPEEALETNMGSSSGCGDVTMIDEVNDVYLDEGVNENEVPKKGFRLFGFDIV